MSLDIIVTTQDFTAADAQVSRWDAQGGARIESSDRLTTLIDALRDAVEDPDAFAIDPTDQVFDADGLLVSLTTGRFEDYEAVITRAAEHGYRVYDPEGRDVA